MNWDLDFLRDFSLPNIIKEHLAKHQMSVQMNLLHHSSCVSITPRMGIMDLNIAIINLNIAVKNW